MKVRTFKELHTDMRNEQDIYPKRGSSLEEICVMNLIDTIHYFDTIKSKVYGAIPIRDKDVEDSFKYFEQIMHQKFDTIEELLKECNIDNYRREFNETNKGK
jgi:hypothetical protein